MKKENKVDFWNTLSCEQQKDIEAGMININNREVISFFFVSLPPN